MIAKEDIEKIRKSVDIVEYLKTRGTEVNRAGSSWTGLCPIHSERTPSFHVKPEAKTFHCFGCGRGGDIFSLVQEMDDLSFYGAILSLAEYANIELQESEDEDFQRIKKLYKLTALASRWFRKSYEELDAEHPAKEYFAERGLTELANSDDSIGFAPANGMVQYLQAAGYTMEDLKEVGLVTRNNEDREPVALFRKRIVWSIRNIQGKTVGFSARKIYETDNGPKYINSPQTPLYNKSKILFGIEQAHKAITEKQAVFVVEGQTDVMALRAAGILNVVAPCGTAFVKEHSSILQRLADRAKTSKKFTINFCFDGDKAGTAAAKKVFATDSSLQTSANVISLPVGEDPSDILKRAGNNGLIEALNKHVSLLEFILKSELEDWDVSNPEGQSGFLKQATTLLSEIDDPSLLEAYQRKVSYWSGAPLSTVISRNYTKKRSSSSENDDEGTKVNVVSLGTLRQRVIASLLQYPSAALKGISQYNIDESMFQNAGRTLFEEALKEAKRSTEAQETTVTFHPESYSDPSLAITLIHETIINEPDPNDARVDEIIGAICKVFSTNYKINQNNKLQSQLLAEQSDSNTSEEDLFREIMESRKGLASPRKVQKR